MSESYRYGRSRTQAIIAARKAGMTFQDIGTAYGITKQRVHQICNQVNKGGNK